MSSANLIFVLFAAFNVVRLFAYIPQLLRIGKDTSGAVAISYWTWGLFAISHLSTVAYAIVVVGDSAVALIFALNTSFCLAIVALTAFKRWQFAGGAMAHTQDMRRPSPQLNPNLEAAVVAVRDEPVREEQPSLPPLPHRTGVGARQEA